MVNLSDIMITRNSFASYYIVGDAELDECPIKGAFKMELTYIHKWSANTTKVWEVQSDIVDRYTNFQTYKSEYMLREFYGISVEVDNSYTLQCTCERIRTAWVIEITTLDELIEKCNSFKVFESSFIEIPYRIWINEDD